MLNKFSAKVDLFFHTSEVAFLSSPHMLSCVLEHGVS
jgi:hypothetical protein